MSWSTTRLLEKLLKSLGKAVTCRANRIRVQKYTQTCNSGFARLLVTQQQTLVGYMPLSHCCWYSTASSSPGTKPKRRKKKVTDEVADTDIKEEQSKKRKCKKMKSERVKAASEETVDSEKPKSQRGRKKKVESELLHIEPIPTYPFEGRNSNLDDEHSKTSTSYSSADDEFGLEPKQDVIEMMNTSQGRFYHIKSSWGERCFPSVTTVLSNTMSVQNFFRLRNWRKSMIKEHGEEGFETISKQIKQSGKSFHQEIEIRLQKDSAPKAPFPSFFHTNTGYMKSVEHVLKDIGHVRALESVVAHNELGYTGTFDCVAKYRGELCVIDWKTSAKPKPTLTECYDFPVQAVAYAGAINEDSNYPFKVHTALIVVAYPNGDPAHAHFLSHEECLLYWSKWLQRLNNYHTKDAGDLSNVYDQLRQQKV